MVSWATAGKALSCGVGQDELSGPAGLQRPQGGVVERAVDHPGRGRGCRSQDSAARTAEPVASWSCSSALETGRVPSLQRHVGVGARHHLDVAIVDQVDEGTPAWIRSSCDAELLSRASSVSGVIASVSLMPG